MADLKIHIKIALGYFFITALLGFLLRLDHISDLLPNYRYIVHTHSHIALLGWVYTALTTLIYQLFLHKKELSKKYRILFLFTQITIVGMLITFPIQGYGLFSIIFSTLYLFASYGFMWFFIRYTSKDQKQTFSYKLIRAGLWYLVISSLGPWVLGIIMNTAGSSSDWYRSSIYFFLHFQYNGWFIVTLFGILFHILEKSMVSISKREFKLFFLLLNLGVICSFFTSILWLEPHSFFYAIALIAVLLHGIAFYILFKKIRNNWKVVRTKLEGSTQLLLKIAGALLATKLLFQFSGSLPHYAYQISQNIDLIVAFLHWIFLGVVSICIFAFLGHFKLLAYSGKALLLYIAGFALTEILLFYKGAVAWLGTVSIDNLPMLITISSGVLLLAIGMLFLKQLNFKKS